MKKSVIVYLLISLLILVTGCSSDLNISNEHNTISPQSGSDGTEPVFQDVQDSQL